MPRPSSGDTTGKPGADGAKATTSLNNPTLTASLASDEKELLDAVFPEILQVAAVWSRRHGIATLRLALTFLDLFIPTTVTLKFTSTTSGAMGSTQTEFGRPVYDEETNAGRFSLLLEKELATAVVENSAEGAVLLGEPAHVEATERHWEFSSGGWLVGFVGAAREIFSSHAGLQVRETSVGSMYGTSGGAVKESPLSKPAAANPPIDTVIADSHLASIGCRVYRLEHMRRPHDYIRCLESWLGSAAFNGHHGFVASVVAADHKSPRVIVAVLHLTIQRDAVVGEEARTFLLQDFSTFERTWRTVAIDVDSKGKPCHERLSRVVLDVEHHDVAPAPVRQALSRSKLDFCVGHVESVVRGFNIPKRGPLCGDAGDRRTVEDVLLQAVGLADPASARAYHQAQHGSGHLNDSASDSQPSSQSRMRAPAPTGPKDTNRPLLPAFVSELLKGSVWA
jgi:hypothetical protein